MTETVNGPARGGRKGQSQTQSVRSQRDARGLRIERVFTTPGRHPYDEVEWAGRDVVMTNWKDGSVTFEQRGVEFPAFWSQNAVNIVASKYFRGAVGTPEREHSLRQLVDRVVDTYARAGREHGYFATDEDAEAFAHELTWMLVHQVFSFNSPVWFNVGTSSPQQVSACLPYDVPVSTPAGLVPIGRLVGEDAVGAKVYDAYGVTKVVATKANGVRDVLRLHTKAGYTLDVTPDHLVWKADSELDGAFVEAGTLRPGDLLLHVEPEAGGRDRRRIEIARVERLGPMEVYDIQTESGEFLAGNLRVHNCFILSVDDTMESILDWYKEEGLIFKGGSGAGLNLSRIRSSKELLSSGGTASGPVSFMRGADASAGTIKSGGATRRAAKMVILDVDHPDVDEFIETKAREEEKIRVLRDAGFDMELGGKDGNSVQYQNANNSVRVTDEFMRAVEADDEFALRARLTGAVVEKVKARDLFGKVTKAAWDCADPGIQYDDTINDWHTCPETGRITASNPCFPADQRVVTDKGLVRIGDLVERAARGETFRVYTNDVTSESDPQSRVVATAPVRYLVTGTNEVLELRFSDGSRLRCTPGHRVWTANRGWVHAEELTESDQVVRSFHYAGRAMASPALPAGAVEVACKVARLGLPEKWDEQLGHFLGWLVGDGCLTGSALTTVYGSEEDREVVGDFVAAIGITSDTAGKFVPESVFEAPEDAVLGFLRGLFDAQGTVTENRAVGAYVGLSNRSEELLLGVQELLASLGVAADVDRTDESYDLRVTGNSMREFAAQVGFTLPGKVERLRHSLDRHSTYDVDETVRLRSRRSAGFETTYNLTEPRNHSYIVSGVVVANCSEYMHLDNSSCNLASLNLLTFLRDDDTFDVEAFRKTVELVITAMDISICFADFPTQKIGETTRAYRQLGIGYANLGALLMATGHGYDSAGGRALAASITSLMTGASYKRSAELAAVVGPYEGYARNADPHKRIIRKHAAANDAVRYVGEEDRALLRAAGDVWADAIRLGERHGYRNAQASVIAPTGTISFMMDCDTTGIEPDFSLLKFKKLVGGDSLQIVNQTVPRALRNLGYQQEQVEAIVEYVSEHGHVVDAPGLRPEHYEVFDCAMGERSIRPMGHVRMMAAVQPFVSGALSKCVVGETLVTSADGLVRIGGLHRGEPEDSFREERLEIASLDGYRKTDAFYYGGVRPVRRVRLRSGHTVTGTLPHRVLVAADGGPLWKPLAEIAAGDAVAVQYGAEMWASVPASLRDIRVSAPYGCQKAVNLPQEMSEDLALLLGAYAAEGHVTRSNWTVVVTNSVPEVLEQVKEAWRTVFGVDARVVRQPGKCPGVVVASKAVVEFLDALGCGSRAEEKRIPDAILQSPREMVLAFLRGLALDAYVTTTGTGAKWGICLSSNGLLDDLQAVLTNLGVLQGRVTKHNKENGKDYDEVYAAGRQGQVLVSLVPFLEPDKARRAAAYLREDYGSGSADVVPGITGRELYQLIEPGKPGRGGVRGWRSEFGFLLDPRTKQVTRETVERVSTLPGVVLPAWLRQVLDADLHFSVVKSVEDAGEAEVYDVSVPETHAFVAGGLVNHNTVNMPESATVDDVWEIYEQGWKLGLKALAIYRDNCKVGQPLSDARPKKATATAETTGESPETPASPVRRRLPKQRPATTTKFSVAGAEGYMTAGTYPDDGLGEVFLKLGKQGSTLAGVMDAFSIAISIGLQYGVPLETFVRQFTNLRFEPAGLTDDPDVRMAQSIMDYVFRRLALDYLPHQTRAAMNILSAAERTKAVNAANGGAPATDDQGDQGDQSDEVDTETLAQSVGSESPAVAGGEAGTSQAADAHSSAELLEAVQGKVADAPMCFTCGTKMRPAGSCYVCEGCGSTSGCS